METILIVFFSLVVVALGFCVIYFLIAFFPDLLDDLDDARDAWKRFRKKD